MLCYDFLHGMANRVVGVVMKKVVLAFIFGMIFGFAIGVAVMQRDMPQYTGPAVLEEARENLDGSTNSVRQGMKNLLP